MNNDICPKCGGRLHEEQEEYWLEQWCMACGWRLGRRKPQKGEAPKWRRGPEPDRVRLRKNRKGVRSMTEADLKRTVEDFLLTLEAQDKLWFERLNSGNILALRGSSKRRIRLCREGTADFIVTVGSKYVKGVEDVIFLELKAPKGKQTEAQKQFQKKVEAQGCEYMLIKSIEEVIAII